jgi:hypothetical protein
MINCIDQFGMLRPDLDESVHFGKFWPVWEMLPKAGVYISVFGNELAVP